MSIQHAVIKCGKCKYKFVTEILVECSVNLFGNSIKEMRCPKGCPGWKKLMVVETPVSKDHIPDQEV